MSSTIRRLDEEADLTSIVQLYNQAHPEPVSPDQLRQWWRTRSDGGIRNRLVSQDEAGALIAYGHVLRDPYMTEGLFWVQVIVDIQRRRNGYGRQMYQALLDDASLRGATHLRAEVRDDSRDGMDFARGLGFQVERHLFESTLDLSTFDEDRFAGAVEKVEASSIRFFTLADAGDTEAARRQLYEINTSTVRDIPGDIGDERPFAVFLQEICDALWYRPDGQILAADGERIVGLAAVGYFENDRGPYMFNMMTGVDRSYRGRGIATALKLLAIRCARRYRAAYLRTNNDSLNAPMLAVNEKLGYISQPGWYRLLLMLSRTSAFPERDARQPTSSG